MKTKLFNKKDELKEFTELFSDKNSELSSKFEKNLKLKYISTLNKSKPNLLSLNIMKILFGTFTASFITLVFILFPTTNLINTLNKEGIFSKVYAANIDYNEVNSSGFQSFAPLRKFSTYNYIHIVKNIILGNRYKECIDIGDFPPYASKYEVYQYFEGRVSLPLYKNIGYSKEGKIIYYALNNDTESISFLGGNFASRLAHEPMKQDTSTEKEPVISYPQQSIEKFFPENAEILIDGNNYIISYIEKEVCDNSGIGHNLYSRLFVDKESYKITKEEKYIEDANNNNLIYSMNIEIDKANKKESDVISIFNYDLPVQLKDEVIEDNNSPSAEEMQEIMKMSVNNSIAYLNTNPGILLNPSDTNFKIMTTYAQAPSKNSSSPSYFGSYSKREFYPDGDMGDELFKKYNENSFIDSETPRLTVSYQYSQDNPINPPSNYIYFSIDLSMYIYESKDTLDELIMKANQRHVLKVKDLKVKIDNEYIDAVLYDTGNRITLNPGEVSNIGSNTKYLILGFEFKGLKYVIYSNYSDIENLSYTSISFSSYDEIRNYVLTREGVMQILNY